jgi:hypothetical protein
MSGTIVYTFRVSNETAMRKIFVIGGALLLATQFATAQSSSGQQHTRQSASRGTHETKSQSGELSPDGTFTMQRATINMAGSPVDGLHMASKKPENHSSSSTAKKQSGDNAKSEKHAKAQRSNTNASTAKSDRSKIKVEAMDEGAKPITKESRRKDRRNKRRSGS